ncbi:MAG TPA: SIS domain-containing protein [Candidatus Limnocylindrales bacterium]|nr:SIS domain-containing protein [Candidatus Limnocylindrales bacterium]
MTATALTDAILRKARESAATKEAFFTEFAPQIAQCCSAMAAAFDRGGRLFVMGNGGSACDAEHLAVEFVHPVIQKRPALPAISLSTGAALATATANDQHFALVFANQLRLLARAGDIALAISSSGQSANIVRGLRTARELAMMTVGFSGRDGGRMRDLCDYCFVVPSFSIHRIQEAHETLLHILWDVIHVSRGEEDVL